jgi:uncharacterized protein (DUF433 family)
LLRVARGLLFLAGAEGSFIVDWRNRIVVDPKILAGKPIVKGTWLSVELILGLLVSGSTPEQVLRAHQDLTLDDVRACCGCALEACKV